MTDRSFDLLFDAWMDLGPVTAPDRVADAARLEARATRQTATLRGWPPRRFSFMNSSIRYALAAAAVAFAAVIGYTYLAGPNVGAPDGPDSTPQPGATLEADLPLLVDQEGPLEPGTYVVTEIEPHRIGITVPAGWARNFVPDTVWAQDSTILLWFGRVETLYADPCGEDGEVRAPGTGVEGLTAALADLPGVEAVTEEITASGFRGSHVEVTVADPLDGWCGGDAVLWDLEPDGGLDLDPFGTVHVWTYDVNGDRIVLAASVRSAARTADVAGLESIIDSLAIEAP